MSNLDHALRYAEQGFFVFPLTVGGKTPACKHGHNDATRDPARIAQLWWNPNFNIAINPGLSGHCVVDIDPPKGWDTLSALWLQHGEFPDTYTTKSPRGGTHYWFKGQTRSALGKAGLGLNIDVKSVHGYVVVPPSTTEKGNYEVQNNAPIAETPAWVVEALIPKMHSARKRDEGIEDDLPHAIQEAIGVIKTFHCRYKLGSDADALRCFLAVRDRGISGETALELVREHLDCDVKDERFEAWLTRKRDNAYAYAQNEAGSRATAPPQEAFGDFIGASGVNESVAPEARKERIDRTKFNADGKPRFYAYSPREAMQWKPPEWIIPDVLPACEIGMLFAPPKSFKTFLIMEMMFSLSAGIQTFNHTPARKYRVVYIAGEGPTSIGAKHLPAWARARGVDIDNMDFHIVRRMLRVAEPGAVDEFVDMVGPLKPDVIIVDTMALSTLGLEENSSKDMGLFVAAMDRVRVDLSCSIVAIHHTGKDTERGSRGSNSVEGAAGFVWLVERHQKSLAVKFRIKEMRDAQEREEPFYFVGQPSEMSVVFSPVSYDEYAKIVKVEKKIDHKFVHTALETCGALGIEKAVSTEVLASTLEPTEEADSKVMKELLRDLRRAGSAGGKLEAYCSGRGQGMRWFIPGAA